VTINSCVCQDKKPSNVSTVEFCARVEPKPKLRPRFGRARIGGREVVRTYTPKKTADFEMLVRTAALRAMLGQKPLTGPLFARIDCYLPIPKSWTKAKREAARAGLLYPVGKPDLDNFKKAVMDAMNGVVYVDDAQIVDDAGKKRYADEPRVDVFIQELDQ
jgi:Holliday junction resolvase RusA-like endonuclease